MKINKLIALLLCIGLFQTLAAQTDQEEVKINNFAASVPVQTNGISTIPNLSLGKPAFTFDLKVGRKLSFEPQFRFALTGKPWAIVFWWRYNAVSTNKFRLDLSTNYSFSYKTITVTTVGETRELIRTTRYLVGAAAPEYFVNKYFSLGAYIFYSHGIEKFITRNTIMLSFRPSLSNIPIAKRYYRKVQSGNLPPVNGRQGRSIFNARLSINRNNFPFSLSALLNKPVKSNIPSEYDLLWNVGLSYTFSNKYIKAR